MKLTKKQLRERDAVTVKLTCAEEDLTEAVETYHTAVQEAWAALTTAVETYNEALAEGRQWVEDRKNELDDFIANKTEKWQESEKGQAVESMREEYDNIDLNDIELTEPDEFELEMESHHELIDNLPTEPA